MKAQDDFINQIAEAKRESQDHLRSVGVNADMSNAVCEIDPGCGVSVRAAVRNPSFSSAPERWTDHSEWLVSHKDAPQQIIELGIRFLGERPDSVATMTEASWSKHPLFGEGFTLNWPMVWIEFRRGKATLWRRIAINSDGGEGYDWREISADFLE